MSDEVILLNQGIYDALCGYLDPIDCHVLSTTSKAVRAMYWTTRERDAFRKEYSAPLNGFPILDPTKNVRRQILASRKYVKAYGQESHKKLCMWMLGINDSKLYFPHFRIFSSSPLFSFSPERNEQYFDCLFLFSFQNQKHGANPRRTVSRWDVTWNRLIFSALFALETCPY
jgi:hypothetical protein